MGLIAVVEIDHEIFYTVLLSRSLIQEGQLLVSVDHEIFSCDHFLPFTDSRRAVISFWEKNVCKYWLTV